MRSKTSPRGLCRQLGRRQKGAEYTRGLRVWFFLLWAVGVVGCAVALAGFWGLGALPRWLSQLLSVVFGFASRRVTFFASAKKVTKESRPDTAVPLRVTTLRCSRQRGAAELARKKTLAQTVLAHSPL